MAFDSLSRSLSDTISDIHNIKIAESSNTLFHYTDRDSATKILESGEIFSGSLAWMNDELEIVYGIEFLLSLLDELHKPYDTTGTPEESLILYLKDSIDQMRYKYNGTFVLSLTEMNDRLSQWRAYGDDGHGVALGFSKTNLLKLPSHGFDVSFMLIPVIYDDNHIKKIKECIHKSFQKNFEIEKKIELFIKKDKEYLIERANQIAGQLALIPLVLKSIEFREEKEWRLLGIVDRQYREKTVRKIEIGDYTKDYLPIDLNQLSHSSRTPISEFLSGPCLQSSKYINTLTDAMIKNNWSLPQITNSKIPYRSKKIK
jgi:hypothetical protein